jgi:hypothetical protein
MSRQVSDFDAGRFDDISEAVSEDSEYASSEGEAIIAAPKKGGADLVAAFAGYARSAEGTSFSFRELAKMTKEVRDVSRNVSRELRVDMMGPVVQQCYAWFNWLKRRTGGEVKNIEELLLKQADASDRMCTHLATLWRECKEGHSQLSDYYIVNNERLGQVFTVKPSYIRQARSAEQEYIRIQKRMGSLSKDDPEYYRLDSELVKARERRKDCYHGISLSDSVAHDIFAIKGSIDCLMQILHYGRMFTEKLGISYFLVGECSRKIARSSLVVSTLMRQSGKMYELVSGMYENLERAHELERKFENDRLVESAYRDIPELPSGLRTGGVVDFVNSCAKKAAEERLLR